MNKCGNCGKEFPNKINIKGQIYSLSGRKFCLDCSPLNSRNTKSYIIQLKENEAFCVYCQMVKKISEFYKRKNTGKAFSYCIQCQERVKKLKFEEKLETLVQIYGGVCHDCKISYPVSVYDFYSDKNIFSISKAKNMSLQKLIEKLNGYIMLCKNCCALRKWEKN